MVPRGPKPALLKSIPSKDPVNSLDWIVTSAAGANMRMLRQRVKPSRLFRIVMSLPPVIRIRLFCVWAAPPGFV